MLYAQVWIEEANKKLRGFPSVIISFSYICIIASVVPNP